MTNDKPLQGACAAEGVSWIWGLHLLLRLVAVGAIGPEEAVAKVEAIRASNPAHIKSAVVDRFQELLALTTISQ